jgi:GNAT superfamily N-acetyltransferase
LGKFTLTVNGYNLAGQIASLINKGGQLKHILTTYSILNNPVQYLIELNGETVIGVVGLHVQNARVTEIKHLCVHPDYRNRGLGKRLLERSIEMASTEFVYGLVRSDNAVNIRNNLRIGMKAIGKKPGRNYSLIIFARRKEHAAGTAINRTV